MNGREMFTFEVFVHDDRYSVPTLYLISEATEAIAREAAEAMLRANPHHLGVELWGDGAQLAALGACDDRLGPRGDALRVAAAG